MTQRSTKDLMNMVKVNKFYDSEGYGLENYDQFPEVDTELKASYSTGLKKNMSFRLSTSSK